ncbi:rhomboid family intramembrane serine protease [Sphingomonas canadensis]|uniref:Rhomboid family intramembrane serine protease n=1 Tax=Sphingomonas canadensis TaxID=1219257 RepID=A0ABW3H6U5_9SPHN|nr:rhomboid family intramembrane serine protease [Sphingomonas canadensis]MCW3836851.1 rhomboid family intramembrane serine protease [Sphingomonas canadensis]
MRWRDPRQRGSGRRRFTAAEILAAMVGAAGLALIVTGYQREALFGLSFIPARAMGAELPPEIASLPVWLTPPGSTLGYFGVLDLIFTCVVLFFIGKKVEEVIGGPAMLLLYALGTYAAAGAYWIEAPMSPMPMAGSFATTGSLLGAAAMLYRRASGSNRPGSLIVHGLWLTVVWAVICVGLSVLPAGQGLMPGWSAGIGSFVLGVALARPLLLWHYRRK